MSNTTEFKATEKTPWKPEGHTPGPWEIGSEVDVTGRRSVSGKGWVRFAEVITRMSGDSEDCTDGLANANLIAAAPDLLKEMERMLVVIKRLENFTEVWDAATQGTGIATSNAYRLAIAKAKGETI